MKQLYYAIQSILHGRGSNATKVISLSLGLTIGILLFSQIAFELNYEKCYPDAERLALVRAGRENVKTGEKWDGYDNTLFAPMAEAFRSDLSQWIENATVIFNFETLNVFKDDHKLKDVNYAYVDTCYFRTFGIKVLKGNPEELQRAGNIFISETFARDIFGGQDPVGQKLSLDKQQELTVRGVYEDTPENTAYHFDFVAPIHAGGGYVGGGMWGRNDIYFTILRLREGVDREEFNRQMYKAMQKYNPDSAEDEWRSIYDAQPLPEIHLDNSNTRTRLYIYGFLGFAIFFVAIMNYVLVAIATMSRRAKSVGVHKCSGASTTNIFSMFLFETGIVVLISIVVALFIIFNARDLIEDLLSVQLSSLFTLETLWVPILIIVVLFIIAGVLPGRLFSRIPVTQVFRRYTEGKKGWKRSLLFIQFMGVAFVLGILLVSLMQYEHLTNSDMGIRTPGLVEAETWMTPEEAENMVSDLRRQPMVESATRAMHGVLGEYWTRGLISNSGERIETLMYNPCDKNYANTMGITIIEGKDMQNEGDVLVNEEVVRLMKWTDGAVGKRLNDFDRAGTIVGVFRNVRNTTFLYKQFPIALVYNSEANHSFDVRLKQPYDENLKKLNGYMEQVHPTRALEFISIDTMLKEIYRNVYRFRNSVWITSTFILLIVIMGLIGYVNDETQRRSKEIAIRKVNGAEASTILRLLSRDILYVAIPSVLIGILASYFTGKAWLEQFAETIELNPLLFVGMALGVIALVVACVVIRAWRIANENPVKSIKAE